MKNEQLLTSSQLLVAVLMVKDESQSIEATLLSLSQGGIRDFFILDTGSQDNTVEIVDAYFKRNKLNGFVSQEPFIDFSRSRNRTLELAEKHFPESNFMVMLDAEWHLQHAAKLIAFCEQERFMNTALYLITIKMNGTEFSAARLFRTKNRIRFKGVVHEVPEVITNIKVPFPICIEVNATSKGMEKSKRRWERDLVLLSAEHKKKTKDPRTAFYLAQTYECLGDFKNAYRFYQHREKIAGWNEENYITLLRLGGLAIKTHQTNPVLGWAIAMDYFLKAFAINPQRIEPLVAIAEYYWPKNIPTCYLFIRQAYDIPYPQNDLLFIDKEAYIYKRYEIMSRCAWYMGLYSLGKKATLQALKVHPEQEHLHKNLELYEQKLEKELV